MKTDAALLDRLLREFHAEVAAIRPAAAPAAVVRHSSGGDAQGWWTSFFNAFPFYSFGGGSKMRQPYAEHPTVHRAMKVMADSVASIPYEVFAGDSDEPVPLSHPVARTLARPSPRENGRQFMSRTMLQLLHYGNAVWLLDGIARLGRGQPQFPSLIRVLRSECLKPDIRGGEHVGWIYVVNGRRQAYSFDETCWFYLVNPYDETWGLGELAALAREADADFATMLSNLRAVRRGGPSVVLEREAGATSPIGSPEADDNLRTSWNEGFKDEDEHTAALLPVGVKANVIGAGAKDMDYEKLRRLARENVGSGLGTVPGVLGILEYANYANMGPQLRYFYNLSVFGYTDLLEDGMQVDLLDRFGTGLRGYFKKESVRALFDDLQQLSTVAQTFSRMGVPFAEINDRLELGFDTSKIPGADQPKDYGGGFGLSDVPPPPAQQHVRHARNAAHDLSERERLRSVLWHGLIRGTADIEAGLYRGLRGLLNELARTLVRNLRKAAPNYPALQRFVAHDIDDDTVYGMSASGEELARVSEPAWKKALQRGGEGALDEAGADLAFNLLDPAILQYLAEKRVLIKNVADSLREEARTIVQRGIEQGSTIDDIAAALEAHFTSPARARVIARTETIDAFSEGRHDALVFAGVEKKEWLSARDDRVRDSHQAADGQVVPVDAPFTLGSGAQMMRPLDHSLGAGPEDIVQCRCVELAVIE